MAEIDEKQAFSIIQKAKETGLVKIGINEVTKAIERGQAKLVVNANDISPAEIVAHLPGLCKEMKVLYTVAGSKAELGSTVGIKSTTAIAVIDAGSAKKDLEAIASKDKEKVAAPKKAEKTESSEEKAE